MCTQLSRREHVKGGGLSEGMREEDLFEDP